MAGGSLSAPQQVDIARGTLTGFGTVAGAVLNAGAVRPSTTGGRLKITGGYQQTSTGVLATTITGDTPGAKFGQLDVAGPATLAGALQADAGGGFTPSHRQSFAVLVSQSRKGKFARGCGHPSLSTTYSATAAKVIYP